MTSLVCDLSIVIVTHDSGGVIDTCLAAIPAAAGNLAFEVILVDNASSDRTTEMARGYSGVTLIGNPVNVGFAAACNKGIAAMHGRHLLLLNPDTVLPPSALPRLLTALEQHPRVGLVAPTLRGSADKPARSPLRRWPTLGRLFSAHTAVRHVARWRRGTLWIPAADRPTTAGYLTGACLLVRGEVLAQLGSLDSSYFFYFEDVEYAARAVAAGWTLLWTTSVAIYHAGGSSTRHFDSGWRHWQFLRSARRYFSSRHNALAFAFAWPLFKMLHVQDLVTIWLKSGLKRAAYARLGRAGAAAKHARRRRLAGEFLGHYAWRAFTW